MAESMVLKTGMIKAVPLDLLYISAELLTGKSVPVLVGITRLPIGQGLAWVMVTLGAMSGTVFSVYAARKGGMSGLAFWNRLLQLGFSLGLSVSLLLSLASGIHAARGEALAVIPAFFSLVQSLPQRHSTALVSLVLAVLVFYACILAGEADIAASHTPLAERRVEPVFLGTPPAGSLTVGGAIARAVQLFVLGFYACVQHAPTQVYFKTDETACDPAYASHHHARHAPYSMFIGMAAAWLRVCVWSTVCFMPDHTLHSLLEGNYATQGSWPCIVLYMTALLYSACWTATQLREQVLPYFCVATEVGRLKALVCIVALAALYRQRSPDAMFYAADALAGVCVLATLLQIEQQH